MKKKIEQAIKLIQSAGRLAEKHGQPVEVCYSGGKDSDVILELVKMAGVEFRAIYKNTTIDPPKTIKHCKDMGVEVMRPRITFFELIQKHGFPSRFRRFCCKHLKEYKVLDVSIQGIRRSESTAREKRYNEPQICRFYGSKKNHVSVFLPILEWTDKDVEEFVKERGITCHPLYYDESGVFRVERRLGCMGCPLRSDNGLADFRQYPNLVKAWLRAGQKWFETHSESKTHEVFGSVFDLFYYHVFCTSHADYLQRKSVDLWGGVLDCKKFLEQFFNIKL
jgi:phosphoadenosine phosphosulfate reductase